MVNTSVPLTRDELFSRVPKSNALTYSTFPRDHRHLLACDASYMIPILVDEVLPGDIFELRGRHLNRLLTSVKPFMDNLYARFIFTYTPTRLVWDKFKNLMGEKRRPDDPDYTNYEVPMLNSGSTGVAVGSIFDFAGITPGVPNLKFNALPFRCMNLFYNEFVRDENLQDIRWVGGSGTTDDQKRQSEFGDSDDINNYSLFRICKKHDYFTSGLPFQQFGPAQTVSIGSRAPVLTSAVTDFSAQGVSPNSNPLYWASAITGNFYTARGRSLGIHNGVVEDPSSMYTATSAQESSAISFTGANVVPANLYADLTSVTGFTISDFRTSFQIQAVKELLARMGHRYKEVVYGEFGVTISDSTLQRPEFLGSYTIPFNIVPVASTAETADNPQGNLSAFGYTDNSEHFGFAKAFEEHGYIIGYMVVQTDQTYQQGLERMWSRERKFDFYTPLLADISEQPIKMKELLAQGADVKDSSDNIVDEKTFNFQEAWAEYRYKPSRVSGKMRSQVDGTLDIWHLATKFSPTILDGENLGVPYNSDFIQDNTRETLERVLAVKDEPQIESDNYFFYKCTREMPIYSVPSYLLGRL